MSNWQGMSERFRKRMERKINDIHVGTAFGLRDSVALGSTTTGSPGVPVDTSNLKQSWMEGLRFPAPLFARLTTNVEYAPYVEEGVGRGGPMILRSEVGGFHSVKLTRVGFPKLVAKIVREVVRD